LLLAVEVILGYNAHHRLSVVYQPKPEDYMTLTPTIEAPPRTSSNGRAARPKAVATPKAQPPKPALAVIDCDVHHQ
jgi:hypothetical protein